MGDYSWSESGMGKKKLNQKRSIRENISNDLEAYDFYTNQNLNRNVQGRNVQGIQSLLDYFSKYNKRQLQTKYDLRAQDFYIDFLISSFNELIEFFESNNNSQKFIQDKKKIIKNLNEILIPKIEQLNLEIDRIIRQKEKLESIISYINNKSSIPPITMNQFMPLNSPRNEWPALGTKGNSSKSKRKL